MKLPIWNSRMILLMRHCIDLELVDTQKDFLESIGMAPSQLRQVRMGKQSFTIDQIVRAAKKYKISANWILGLSDEMMLKPGKSAMQQLKDAVRAIEAMHR